MYIDAYTYLICVQSVKINHMHTTCVKELVTKKFQAIRKKSPLKPNIKTYFFTLISNSAFTGL